MAEAMRPHLEKGFDKLLFSYHGLPYRHLRKSDPSHAHCLSRADCCDGCHPAHQTCYRHQVLRTTEEIAARLGLRREQYENSFQSRLAGDPWLTPYTDYRLRDLPKEGVQRLLVACPAFVSDCLETLEEIAMRGREIFLEAGGKEYALIPCLNEHPAWIAFLRDEIRAWLHAPPPSRLDQWKQP
jgi:ferrochelatase